MAVYLSLSTARNQRGPTSLFGPFFLPRILPPPPLNLWFRRFFGPARQSRTALPRGPPFFFFPALFPRADGPNPTINVRLHAQSSPLQSKKKKRSPFPNQVLPRSPTPASTSPKVLFSPPSGSFPCPPPPYPPSLGFFFFFPRHRRPNRLSPFFFFFFFCSETELRPAVAHFFFCPSFSKMGAENQQIHLISPSKHKTHHTLLLLPHLIR